MESAVPERTDHDAPDDDTTCAIAHLPGFDIAIEHRRSPSADAEMISIHLQAVPSFEAFGRYLEAANPFAFWAKAAQFAWQPWLRRRALAHAVFRHDRQDAAQAAGGVAAVFPRRLFVPLPPLRGRGTSEPLRARRERGCARSAHVQNGHPSSGSVAL